MKTIIIDSSALAHRVKYALAELNTEFYDTGVIFGFLKKMLEIAVTFNTRKFYFTFDSKSSERKEIYPEYKARRKENISEEIKILNLKCYKQLFQLRKQILPHIGFKNIFQSKGYEADDLIAILVENFEEDYIVYSGDADLYQLLDYCSIYKPNHSVYSVEDFQKEFDITPKEWIQVKSIAGCKSDNVRGVNGIGEKRAIQYIKNQASKLIKEKIERHRDLIELNRKVVQLPMKYLPKIEPYTNERLSLGNFIDVCQQFDLKSLMTENQLAKWGAYFEME